MRFLKDLQRNKGIMASSDKELEEQLVELGNKLVQPPPSVDELLHLLDRVENCLARVEQSPDKSTQNALSPSMNAMVARQLLRHPDVDVRVAVASCISEITRITAPEAPYDDEQMKEVFHLIVSSFENLSDHSSRSYNKRTSILETVAKVRSCVVMLDLECDALILQMFRLLFRTVREYHPENVVLAMETIMTLVINESEDISLQLLSPILSSVRLGNEEVLPIARILGERVLRACASKLKPYIVDAVESNVISLDDYSEVLASVCDAAPHAAEQNDLDADEPLVAENLVGALPNQAAEVAREPATEVASPGEVDPDMDKSLKSVMSNGVTQIEDDDALVQSNSLKKPEEGHGVNQTKSMDVLCKDEVDNLDDGKVIESEQKLEQTTTRKGKKPNNSINSTEPSDSSHVDGEKETDKMLDKQKNPNKEVCSLPCKDPSVEAVAHLENEKESGIQQSSPVPLARDAVIIASPSQSGSLLDEGRSKKGEKGGRSKKKESLIQEVTPSAEDVPKKLSERANDSEVKTQRRPGKKSLAGISNVNKSPVLVEASKEEGVTTSDSEAKSLKQSEKKEGVMSDLDAKSLKKSGKKEGTARSDSAAKSLKLSGKKEGAATSYSKTKSLKQSGKKEGGSSSDAEVKSSKKSGKKESASTSDTEPKSAKMGKKIGVAKSDLEAKSSKLTAKKANASPSQSGKKVDASNANEDGSSKKRRQGRGKSNLEKDATKSTAKISDKGEGHVEETPKGKSKRKRTPGNEKASGSKELGEELVGSKVKVWWPDDEAFYEGVITSFDVAKKKHTVSYTDGDMEILTLKDERWEFVTDSDSAPNVVEQETTTISPDDDTPLEMSRKKKVKLGSGLSSKQVKMAGSPKKVGGVSISKSKGGSTKKSSRKSKDVGKAIVGDSEVDISELVENPVVDNGAKSKEQSPKVGSKSTTDSPKTAGKVKSDEPEGGAAARSNTKSKQGTPKPASKSKGKSPKTGTKSKVNGTGNAKSGNSKAVKEIEDVKEMETPLQDSAKEPENANKRKSLDDSSKVAGESEGKIGKKRRRTAKSQS